MIIGFALLSMLEKQQTVYDWQIYYFVLVIIYLMGYFVFLFIKVLFLCKMHKIIIKFYTKYSKKYSLFLNLSCKNEKL